MAKMTNSEITKAITEELSESDKKLVEGKEGIELLKVFENYPNVQNSFIQTLTNKVTKSLIYSKIFTNPLKNIKKGKIEYGESIEELFVQMAMAKNFGEHWGDGAETPEADLIRALMPQVSAMYISVNFDKKYKTTVFDKQIRKAFINEYGLSNLVMQIVGSITSQAEYQEFIATKGVINNLVSECKQSALDTAHNVESTVSLPKGTVVKQTPYIVQTTTPRDLVKSIREEAGNMAFPSTKYNLAKELNWCNPDNLMLLTTPGTIADIDVNVLASAFNSSATEIKYRVILVDEMPKGIFKGADELTDKSPQAIETSTSISCDGTKKVKAILFDADLLQIWDSFQGAGTFYNSEKGYTNHFANREGIFSVCTFANMAVFYE